MQAIILDNHWVKIDQLVPQHEPLLIDHFSVKHPKTHYINDTSQQSWDGWYRKYNVKKQRIAKPLLTELNKFCKSIEVPLEIIDKRPKERHPVDHNKIKEDLLPGISLDHHQLRAIKAACSNECGLISAVTGAGKTEIMAAITRLYGLPTVIIADQRVVIEQIKERLELREIGQTMDGKSGVGLFYGGETPDGQMIVIGSIQSLSTPPPSVRKKNPAQYYTRRDNAELFQQIVSKAGLLLVDECDKATDNRYRKLFMKYFQGRYKFGFSGTCFDPDKPVEELKLKEHLGSIIVEITRRQMEKIGRIIPVKAMMIGVGDPADRYDRMAFDIAEKELIVENEQYHQLIKKIVKSYPGERTMILVDTNNVVNLGTALQECIDNSLFIYGKTGKKARNMAIQDFEQGKLECLIGGKILKRGLDIEGGVHNLIVCGGGKSVSDFDQKIGRAVRNNDRGWARLICLFHMDNFYLYRHSKAQLKTIVSLGYQCSVSVNGKIVDAKDLIRRNFRLPK